MLVYQTVKEKSNKGDLVLDVGTGNGQYLSGISASTVAIDISFSSGTGPNKVDYMCTDGRQLPFPDNTFDYVICNQVLEHVQSKNKVIKEISRVIKNSGEFHVAIPNRLVPTKPHFIPRYMSMLPKNIGCIIAPYVMPDKKQDFYFRHIYHISPIGLRRLLNRHFDSVKYSSLSLSVRYSDTYSSLSWKILILFLPLINLICKFISIYLPFELLWPYVGYECTIPNKTSQPTTNLKINLYPFRNKLRHLFNLSRKWLPL